MNSVNNDGFNDALAAMEKSLEAKIPAQLLDYIRQNQDQEVNKRFDRIVNGTHKQELDLWKVLSLDSIREAYNNLMPDPGIEQLKLLPFGESLGSPIICMSLHQDNYGSIYVHDYDFGPTRVADSLSGFLSILKK